MSRACRNALDVENYVRKLNTYPRVSDENLDAARRTFGALAMMESCDCNVQARDAVDLILDEIDARRMLAEAYFALADVRKLLEHGDWREPKHIQPLELREALGKFATEGDA